METEVSKVEHSFHTGSQTIFIYFIVFLIFIFWPRWPRLIPVWVVTGAD